MKLTNKQLTTLADEIEAGAEVPFDVRVTVANPNAKSTTPLGRAIAVRLSDRWGVDFLEISQEGLVTRPKPTARKL